MSDTLLRARARVASHLIDRLGEGADSPMGLPDADVIQMTINSLIVANVFSQQAMALVGLFDQPAQRGKMRGTLVKLSTELAMIHAQMQRAESKLQDLHDELKIATGSLGAVKWP